MHCFDIIGPVMVGPSSSHTAGAVRLGQVARALLEDRPVRAVVGLHGSFARTGPGHGTDKAIVAGLLGFSPDDERIRTSFELARASGLLHEMRLLELDRAHPNTAVISLWGETGRTVTLKGASTGGGRIRIEAINDLAVSFSGEYMTLVIHHQDTPGIVAGVTQQLSAQKINIANMRVFRAHRGGTAVTVIETDQPVSRDLCHSIRLYEGVNGAVLIQPVGDPD